MSVAVTDPFDLLLIDTAQVMTRTSSSPGGYGGTQSFNAVGTPVPCRVSTGAAGVGKEFRAKAKEDIYFRRVFMRPWYDPDENPLNHDHWLQVTDKDGNQTMYDIFDILNPGGLNHHLEVWCRILAP